MSWDTPDKDKDIDNVNYINGNKGALNEKGIMSNNIIPLVYLFLILFIKDQVP